MSPGRRSTATGRSSTWTDETRSIVGTDRRSVGDRDATRPRRCPTTRSNASPSADRRCHTPAGQRLRSPRQRRASVGTVCRTWAAQPRRCCCQLGARPSPARRRPSPGAHDDRRRCPTRAVTQVDPATTVPTPPTTTYIICRTTIARPRGRRPARRSSAPTRRSAPSVGASPRPMCTGDGRPRHQVPRHPDDHAVRPLGRAPAASVRRSALTDQSARCDPAAPATDPTGHRLSAALAHRQPARQLAHDRLVVRRGRVARGRAERSVVTADPGLRRAAHHMAARNRPASTRRRRVRSPMSSANSGRWSCPNDGHRRGADRKSSSPHRPTNTLVTGRSLDEFLTNSLAAGEASGEPPGGLFGRWWRACHHPDPSLVTSSSACSTIGTESSARRGAVEHARQWRLPTAPIRRVARSSHWTTCWRGRATAARRPARATARRRSGAAPVGAPGRDRSACRAGRAAAPVAGHQRRWPGAAPATDRPHQQAARRGADRRRGRSSARTPSTASTPMWPSACCARSTTTSFKRPHRRLTTFVPRPVAHASTGGRHPSTADCRSRRATRPARVGRRRRCWTRPTSSWLGAWDVARAPATSPTRRKVTDRTVRNHRDAITYRLRAVALAAG